MTGYAFGDSHGASQRLAMVAAVFRRPTCDFLSEWGLSACPLAVDLGCGPGFTTRLLRDALAPTRVVGLEASPSFARLAREQFPDLTFVEHDVTDLPLPLGPADLLYARFLVSHLSEPARALRGWVGALRPGGRLLLDEVEWIRTEGDVFREYLALVEETLAARGHCLYVGRRLGSLAQGLSVRASAARIHSVNPRMAARMFRRNLDVLRPDDVELGIALGRIIRDGGPSVTWVLRQLVIEA